MTGNINNRRVSSNVLRHNQNICSTEITFISSHSVFSSFRSISQYVDVQILASLCWPCKSEVNVYILSSWVVFNLSDWLPELYHSVETRVRSLWVACRSGRHCIAEYNNVLCNIQSTITEQLDGSKSALFWSFQLRWQTERSLQRGGRMVSNS